MIALAAVLLAQDAHQHHAPPPPPPPPPSVQPKQQQQQQQQHAHDHHQHAPTEPEPEVEVEAHHDHQAMDHSQMDHGTMDHGQMDHAAMGHGTDSADKLAGIPKGPPPRSAGNGPARAAERLFGEAAMQRARAALIHETGNQAFFWFQADRLEARLGGEDVGFLWDAQASYGGDLDKLWIESEGEGDVGEGVEDADIEATWSHAIAPYWDLQLGARQDLAGSSRTYATVGVQGLAPYLFEVDAAAYLSSEGEVTAEIEAELDQRITQRLILQPRGELVLAAQDIPDLALGAGLAKAELGVRLRYEFSREFAPYVGIAQEWRLGSSRDLARAQGEDVSATRFVAGVRFWF